MSDRLNLTKEIQRKSIHILTSVIPFAYYFGVEKQIILIFSLILATGFLTADLLRMNFALARKYFLVVFSGLLREGELEKKITGATYLFIGMAIAFWVFPKIEAIAAVLFLTLADPVAAIAGKRFGKRNVFGKTLEGSLGFFLTAAAIILFMTNFGLIGLSVALLATFIELLPMRINDNLLIPVVSGLVLFLLG